MEDGARAARFTMHGAQLGVYFVLLVIFNALLSSGAESSFSR